MRVHDQPTTATTRDEQGTGSTTSSADGRGGMGYGRFWAMIATSTVVMFGLMYLNTYALDHVRFSETRAYMALYMGATMAIIMLGFMWSMYRSRAVNVAIVVASALVAVGAVGLVRSQVTVEDRSWMRAMIPHHSIAILTSENAEKVDLRVQELSDGIIETQRREISEMEWLIDDIAENGPATTPEEADARPVPEFGS